MAGRSYREPRKLVVFTNRVLILCEGETEENYFKGLVTQAKYRRQFSTIDVNIFKPKNHSPVGLVQRAKELMKIAKREKNPYNFAWVVFDKDGHANMAEAFEIARNSTPEIKIAFTIPCFEYYVLLHFEKTTKPFTKCDTVISRIKKQKYITDYEKASENLFALLIPQMETGIANSKWICKQFEEEIDSGKKIYDLSAYSNIHELIDFLYSLLKKKKQ